MRRSQLLPRLAPATVRSGGSWLALVAATTLGVSTVDTVRAEVSLRTPLVKDAHMPHRLVVQAYSASSLDSAGAPNPKARPLRSTQRAVVPEELQAGLEVQLFGVDELPLREPEVVILAWVEPGEPDLEFDGLTARPLPGAIAGTARPAGTRVRVILRHRV